MALVTLPALRRTLVVRVPAKRFVAAGLGCSTLPATAVASERRDPAILVRPLRPALTCTFGLALRHDKIIDKVLRETITAIERLSSRLLTP